MSFIDIEKAFDWISWKSIWKALQQYHVDETLVRRIRSFYKVCTNELKAKPFLFITLLHELLSKTRGYYEPLLFPIVMDMALKKCAGFKEFKLGNRNLQPAVINILAYADDLVLLAENAEKLQHNLNLLVIGLEVIRLKINLNNTKTMVVAREQVAYRISVNWQGFEQTREFKFLAVLISDNGKLTSELNVRLHNAGACN